MTANLAFTKCPICGIRYDRVDGIHHFRVPCEPVRFLFGELVAFDEPRRSPRSRTPAMARLTATVTLEGRRYVVDCTVRTGEFPTSECDASCLDAAIVGRLLWPYPNTRIIADAALALVEGGVPDLPIDLVFVDPGPEFFELRASNLARPISHASHTAVA